MNNTGSQSIRIATSRGALWDVLTRIADIADWYDNWDAVEYDELNQRHLGHETRFRLIRIRNGHVEGARCLVTLVDAPHRLGWIEDGPHGRTVFVAFHLEPDPSGGTVLTLSKSYRSPSALSSPPGSTGWPATIANSVTSL